MHASGRMGGWAFLLAFLSLPLAVYSLDSTHPVDSSATNTDKAWEAVNQAMTEGYLAAKADDAGDTNGIERGPLYRIGSIEVVGGLAGEAWESLLFPFRGKPASRQTLEDLRRFFGVYFLDSGHPFAAADFAFHPSEHEASVGVVVSLRGLTGYKFGGFRPHGSRIRPEILDKLSLLAFGEAYSEKRVNLAVEKLARSGYFEVADRGTLYRDSVRNLIYPALHLSDYRGSHINGLLGFDSEREDLGQLTGFVDIRLMNLLGTARDLDFTFASRPSPGGGPEREVRLLYQEPWLPLLPIGAILDFNLLLQDTLYSEIETEVGFHHDLDFRSRYRVLFGRQSNNDRVAGEESRALSSGLEFIYDARRGAARTTGGYRFSQKVRAIRRTEADSSRYFAGSSGELAWWREFGSRFLGHTRVSGGGNWPLRARENRGDRHRLGGANTLRGYPENAFSTNLYLYGNLEVQYRINAATGVALFAVPGLINRPEVEGVYWRRVMGYGIGLDLGGKEWNFGISYALNPQRAPGDGYLHLRVLNSF